jgi:SAM-dependent methyltransferase
MSGSLIYKISHAVSAYNRERKWRLFQQFIPYDKDTKVLDVGFNDEEYYSEIENYLERHYPYQKSITALGLHEPKNFKKRYPAVEAITYDGITFPFPDKSFDICWSNAVLEHVGNFERQVHFVREIARVSHSFFITTPNRLFPIEVHTKIPLLHYLPEEYRDFFYCILGKKWATGNYMFLLSKRRLKKILKEAGINSYTLKENYLGPFVLDFVVIFPKRF